MKVKYDGFILSKKYPDNTILLEDGSIAEIINFVKISKNVCIKI